MNISEFLLLMFLLLIELFYKFEVVMIESVENFFVFMRFVYVYDVESIFKNC